MNPVLESVNEATPFEPYICGEKVNFSYLAHYHKELEIIKVNDGETLIIKNGQRVKLRVGDIMFISPFEIHEYISFGRNSMAVMKFCIPDDFPETIVDSVISPNDERYAKIADLLDNIVRIEREKTAGYKSRILAEYSRLLVLVLEGLNTERNEDKKNEKEIKFFNLVNDYLEKNYARTVTLDDIARESFYSKYYFEHVFKKTIGMCFGEYLVRFRLKKAEKDLQGNTSITNVAYNNGFNSLRAFNRSFKRYYGETPTEYKKNLKV